MNGEMFIPIFLFGGTAAVLIVYFTNRHKERMAIIEKGLNPEDYKELYKRHAWTFSPLSSLKWGLVALFVGAGLFLGSWLDQYMHLPDSVYPASMLVLGGLGLVIFYVIAAKKVKNEGM